MEIPKKIMFPTPADLGFKTADDVYEEVLTQIRQHLNEGNFNLSFDKRVLDAFKLLSDDILDSLGTYGWNYEFEEKEYEVNGVEVDYYIDFKLFPKYPCNKKTYQQIVVINENNI